MKKRYKTGETMEMRASLRFIESLPKRLRDATKVVACAPGTEFVVVEIPKTRDTAEIVHDAWRHLIFVHKSRRCLLADRPRC